MTPKRRKSRRARREKQRDWMKFKNADGITIVRYRNTGLPLWKRIPPKEE